MLVTLIAVLFGGIAAMMEWRIDAVQHQLSDRLVMYHHQIDELNKRLDRLDTR